MKTCSKCKIKKDTSEYSVDRQKSDGFRSSCKQCNMKPKKEEDKYRYLNEGIKRCTKCKEIKKYNEFRLDASKRDGLYPSCIDCYRRRVGNTSMMELYGPRIQKECYRCKTMYFPRRGQIRDNVKGNFYCSRKCMIDPNRKTYINAYRDKIIERDGGCILCKSKDNLHVHHIKTRGSGGTDEYLNLVTLCTYCHLGHAHGLKGHEYRKQFEEYVLQFDRPDYWDEIMKKCERNIKNTNLIKKYNCSSTKKYHSTKSKERRKEKEINDRNKRNIWCIENFGYEYKEYVRRKKNGLEL